MKDDGTGETEMKKLDGEVTKVRTKRMNEKVNIVLQCVGRMRGVLVRKAEGGWGKMRDERTTRG